MGKKFVRILKKKKIGEYHDFNVQRNTLLLADLFVNFRNNCLGIYELNPARFLIAPRLAWQLALRKTKVRLGISNDINMLLNIEKGIRGGIYQDIHRYAKANNKYMNHFDENEESSYLKYWDVNNLYSRAMSQKLPVKNFKED